VLADNAVSQKNIGTTKFNKQEDRKYTYVNNQLNGNRFSYNQSEQNLTKNTLVEFERWMGREDDLFAQEKIP